MDATISRAAIAARGRHLVEALGGEWRGERGLCHCPAHRDCTPSLSVRVGREALLFKCFAGCDTQAVLRSLWCLDPAALAARSADPVHTRGDSWSQQKVATLWGEAWPILGTPAEAYLAARGITTAPAALRFHPRTPVKLRQRLHIRPALLTAVREHQRVVALQRSFLAVGQNTLALDFPNPRRMLGRPLHGAVMLARPGRILGLAEGVETALSAMQLLRIPVWATLGAERFAQIHIPAGVEQLILLPDNDAAGRAACNRALASYASQGLAVVARMPPRGTGDWNDAVQLKMQLPSPPAPERP